LSIVANVRSMAGTGSMNPLTIPIDNDFSGWDIYGEAAFKKRNNSSSQYWPNVHNRCRDLRDGLS
ncbi:MAG TPA: hypothetical protein VLC51_09885, partial [Nitrospira sp.]|nr:hypothetical protein [Nitrospira sp.]